MPRYWVRKSRLFISTANVEADNEEEAIEKAIAEADWEDSDHQDEDWDFYAEIDENAKDEM